MRVTTRMTLALGTAGLLLFGVFGVVSVQSESVELRRGVLRELDLLGRSLQVAVENALRDRQLSDVQETLDRLERIDPGVDIYVAGGDGRVQASSAGAKVDDADVQTALGEVLAGDVAVLRERDGTAPRFLLALPLRGDDGRLLGGLAVARPTDDMLRDLGALRGRIWILVGAFALAVALLGQLVGAWLIGRPLAKIAAAMGAVGGGEAAAEGLPSGGGSEIRSLVNAFEAMEARLAHARARVQEEEEARRAVERGLVRADKLITLGQLSAGLAHEIGSPLQVLAGRGRALASKASDPEAVRRTAAILVEQVERIARIVDALLATTRRRPSRPQSLRLAEPVGRVLALIEPQARRRGLQIRLQDDSGEARVRVDPDHAEQIALNLLRNALQFAPGGSTIDVSWRAREQQTDLGALRTGAAVVALRVADAGPGVPEADRARLFDPFFTTRADQGGTGLGLAVARDLAREHGGELSLVPSEQGACFELVLPVEEAR